MCCGGKNLSTTITCTKNSNKIKIIILDLHFHFRPLIKLVCCLSTEPPPPPTPPPSSNYIVCAVGLFANSTQNINRGALSVEFTRANETYFVLIAQFITSTFIVNSFIKRFKLELQFVCECVRCAHK